MNKKYIHIKTGRLYSLLTNNFMFKENGEWRKGLVLYQAEYDNPDGKYFARTKEDFYSNFKEIDMETKMVGWVARDKSGVICWFSEKPFKVEEFSDIWGTDEGFELRISDKCFPEVTFENSPQKCEISFKLL